MPVRYSPSFSSVSSPLPQGARMNSGPRQILVSYDPSTAIHPIPFFLFVLLNAVLFIRQAEIMPELTGLPIYEWVILACLAVSIPGVLALLKPSSLVQQPITVCVLVLLPPIILSHLAHFNLYSARWSAYDFFHVAIYYLFFVSLLTSSPPLS